MEEEPAGTPPTTSCRLTGAAHSSAPQMTNAPSSGALCILAASCYQPRATRSRRRNHVGLFDRAGLRGLYEPLAERAEVVHFGLRQLVVPLGEVRHGLVEPLSLMLLLGADHAAPHDVLKHFIARLLERRRLGTGTAT